MLSSQHVYTHLILVILMQIHATFLTLPPPFRHRIIHISLMYDFRNQLRAIVNEWGIRRWNLGGVDGVCGAVFDKEGEEGVDGADEEDDY